MNFNITTKPDYSLQARHTHEVINLYGTSTKLLLTEKIEYDSTVFGDYQSIKTNSKDTFTLNMMPETSETYDDIGTNFSEFGMMNVETIRLFVSRKSLEPIFEEGDYIKSLQGNLVILPNNRVLEITDVEFMVPGINNLFTERDIKNVYKLTLVTYSPKLSDDIESIKELETDDIGSYKELDSYFDELTSNKNDVHHEATVKINTETEKTDVADADSVFGRF